MLSVEGRLREGAASGSPGGGSAHGSAPLLPLVACTVAAAAISTATLAGLALALLGLFSAHAVAAIAIVAAVLVARPICRHSTALTDRPALVLLVVAGASVLVNASFADEHVLTDRDPGVYLNVAISLAAEGSLVLDPQAERYGAADVDLSSQGFEYHEEDGLIRPQFFHGFPALIAVVDGVFGHRAAVRVPAMLGGVSILAFGLVLRRFVPPWPATLGAGALALLVIQMWVSRDTYSEALAQPLLWLSLLFLISTLDGLDGRRHEPRSVRAFAFAAGLSAAALWTTRIESPILIPVLVVWALVLRRRGATSGTLGAAAGLPAIGLLLWLADFVFIARPYWYLTGELLRLTAASAAAGVLFMVGILVGPRRRLARLVARQRRVGALIAASVVLLVFGLGLARSELHVDKLDAVDSGMQMIEVSNGLEPEGLRTYAEQSSVWLTWYLGWPAFVAGVLGLALLTHRALTGKGGAEAGLLAVATVPVTALYLWNPSIYPDHLWAMRRYIVAALPLLVLGATVLSAFVVSRLDHRAARGAAAAGLWAVVYAGIWSATAPLLEVNSYDGHLGLMENVCGAMPEDAVVLVDTAQSLHLVFLAPVRAFCDVPSAALEDSSPEVIERAATEVRQSGGRPVLLTADPSARPLPPPEAVFTVTSDRYQGFSLSKPTGLSQRATSVAVILL